MAVYIRLKGNWLKRPIEINLYYCDPALNLGSLAEKLGMQPHELSKVLNTVFNKGVNYLINEYRAMGTPRKWMMRLTIT